MYEQRHWAINIITGEIIGTNHANYLKRRVAQITRWNVTHGYGAGKWRFYHGAYEGLRCRALGA